MTTRPPGAIHGTTARVLLAVIELAEQNPTVTITDLAEAVGVSRARIHRHLTYLRRLQLVAWTPGKQGSIRPAAVRVPFAA